MRYVARPLADNEKEEDVDGEEDLSIAKLHPKLKFLKDFDVNSSNYQKVSQASNKYARTHILLYSFLICVSMIILTILIILFY
jgi:hypothetical protein